MSRVSVWKCANCYEEWRCKPHFLILRNAGEICGSNVNSGFTLPRCSFAASFREKRKTDTNRTFLSLLSLICAWFSCVCILYLNFSEHIFCFLFILKQIYRGRNLNRKGTFCLLFFVYFLYQYTTLHCHALCKHWYERYNIAPIWAVLSLILYILLCIFNTSLAAGYQRFRTRFPFGRAKRKLDMREYTWLPTGSLP